MELDDASNDSGGVHISQTALLRVDGLVLAVDVLPPRLAASAAVSSS